ncbi:hypothetical protein D3C72_947920 [compost metagenome]
MIADGDGSHALADRFNDCSTFVAEDRREDAFRVSAGKGVGIGMANTGSHHAQQHFTCLGHGDINFNDLQRFLGLECNGGA